MKIELKDTIFEDIEVLVFCTNLPLFIPQHCKSTLFLVHLKQVTGPFLQ